MSDIIPGGADRITPKSQVIFSTDPQLQGLEGALVFHAQKYSDFLRQVGFSEEAVSSAVVNIKGMSPFMTVEHEHGIPGKKIIRHYGNFGFEERGQPTINLFLLDIIDAVGRTQGASTDEEGFLNNVEAFVNGVLKHETGHMFESVVKGVKQRRLEQSLYRRMGMLGSKLLGISQAMVTPDTAEAIMPVYAGYPLQTVAAGAGSFALGVGLLSGSEQLEARRYASSPREAFANDFASAHTEAEFITMKPGLT